MSHFPTIKFQGKLRPSQQQVVDLVRPQLEAGKRQLYVVAPPGSGKTVLGLYLWAECVRRPALVLSPNSAIQAQWAARIDLFAGDVPLGPDVSTSADRAGLLTSLTYQAVTLPRRGDDGLDESAIGLWQDRLVEEGQAQDPAEAYVWIRDLQRHNVDYYEQRLSAYRKQIRDEAGQRGESFEMLHDSSLRTLTRLRDIGVGLIILDECHHLLGHWGRVLADAREFLNDPVILGLTATPPDGSGASPVDFERYAEMLGEVDHDVPVPAVVRDGFLAPYQDLVYFVRPTADELRYVAQADQHLTQVLDLACAPREHTAEIKVADDAEIEVCEAEVDSEEETSEPLSALHVVSSSEVVFDESTDAPAPLQAGGLEFDDLEPVVNCLASDANRVAPLPNWLFTALAERRHAAVRLKSWGALVKRDPEFCQAARAFLQMREIPLPENVPPLEIDHDWSEVPEISIVVPVLDRYVRHALRRSPSTADHELARQIISGLRMLGVQITETGCQACASPVGRVLAYSQAKVSALIPILTAEMEALGDRLRAVVVTDFEKTSATLAGIKHLLNEEAGGAIAAFRTLVRNEKTEELNPILVTGSSVLVDDDLAEAFDHAAEAWLEAGGYDAKLSYAEEEGFHVVSGSGKDWCPRVYVEMITELFQRGLTRCLVGTRGLLGEGWDASKINVLVDLTTVTTSMSVRQLRGRSFRLDSGWPEKVANNWDVVCLAPEFSKGLDDYARFIRKHENIFGVTDDAVIEKGVGHVHAALTQSKPELLDGSAAELNDEMLARAARRQQARELWKIGTPYDDQSVHTLEAKLERRESERAGFPPFSGNREMWSSESLSQAIGTAILYALEDAKLLPAGRRLKTSSRDGGYVRLFLEEATSEESHRFVQALQEALGPLHRPRYVIPRKSRFAKSNWFTRKLPEFLKTYFEPSELRTVMIHAVPSELARNREIVAVYEKYWNQLVSPGEAVFALRTETEEEIAAMTREGLTPGGSFHAKEIFR